MPAALKGQKRGARDPLNPLVVSSHVVLWESAPSAHKSLSHLSSLFSNPMFYFLILSDVGFGGKMLSSSVHMTVCL